jgi:hypothetical protein
VVTPLIVNRLFLTVKNLNNARPFGPDASRRGAFPGARMPRGPDFAKVVVVARPLCYHRR